MARTPRPWYWVERGAWYATVGGIRHQLAKGKRHFPAAQKRLRELLSARDAGVPARTLGVPLLGDAAADYLEHLKARQKRGEVAAGAVDDFRRRVAGFVEAHGALRADTLRPHHVTAWLDTRTSLGPTSRHDAVGAVKGITGWAHRQGLIPTDPLAGLRKPPKARRRLDVTDAREVPAILTKIPPGPFLDFVRFLYLTGARPGEAAALEAAHVDPARRVAILDRHKTSHRTRRARVIALPSAALDLIAPLMARHPDGPVFRNAEGRAWNRYAIKCAVHRLRKAGAVPPTFTVYQLRHGFATDALAAGEPLAIVAEMLGHASPRMLGEVYSHLDKRVDLLAEAAERVRRE